MKRLIILKLPGYKNEWGLVDDSEIFENKSEEEKINAINVAIEDILKEVSKTGVVKYGDIFTYHVANPKMSFPEEIDFSIRLNRKMKYNDVYNNFNKHANTIAKIQLKNKIYLAYEFYYNENKNKNKHNELTKRLNKEFYINKYSSINKRYTTIYNKM